MKYQIPNLFFLDKAQTNCSNGTSVLSEGSGTQCASGENAATAGDYCHNGDVTTSTGGCVSGARTQDTHCTSGIAVGLQSWQCTNGLSPVLYCNSVGNHPHN